MFLTAASAAVAQATTPAPAAPPTDPLAAVDEILQQVSDITGLPIKHKVKSEVVSRDQIRAYISQRMKETTTPAEMHAQQVALIKFGLLPKGFELEKFVLELLTEQATAFYDPKQKKFFLSDWAPLDLQKPAIAHELTHALQDQCIDLEPFMEIKGREDEMNARTAVVEGEAVLAMMDYMLAPMGQKAADMPNLTDMVSSATSAESAQFPIFAKAPMYLKESLLFPYTAGLTFTQTRGKGKGKAIYAELLKNPPKSTHEILHPADPPLTPAELQAPEVSKTSLVGFVKLDSNVFGELDVYLLLKQMLSATDARAVSPGWRGMRFEVYENSDGRVILAHRSKWKDAESAKAFAEAYKRVIEKKGADPKQAQLKVSGDLVDVIE
jgi:hypothetical protein